MANEIYKTFSAIKNNRFELLRELLKNNNGLLNYSNKNGENLFLYACKHDSLESAKVILELNPKNIFSKNIKNQNFLHILSLNDSGKIWGDLLKNFPNEYKEFLSEKDKSGNIPFFYMLSSGSNTLLKKFIKKINCLEFIKEENLIKQNVLHFLAKNEKIKINKDLDFLKNKENLNQYDQHMGYSPSFFAALYLNKENFKFFFNNKNDTNILGQSLLSLSIQNDNLDTFEYLLDLFPNDLEEKIVDLSIEFKEDQKLKLILNKNIIKPTDLQIKNIFKNIASFPLTANILLEEQSSNIREMYFIHETFKDFKSSVKINDLDYDSLLNKIINHKKEMVEKISLLHKEKLILTKEESESFFKTIKKLPIKMQLNLINKESITKHFPEIIQNEIKSFLMAKEFKQINAKYISANMVGFYISFLDEIKKDINFNNFFEKIYEATDEKRRILKFFREFTLNEIYDFNFPVKEDKKNAYIYRTINLLSKENVSEKELNLLSSNSGLLKKSLILSLGKGRDILNEELLRTAKNNNVYLEIDDFKCIFQKNINFNKNLVKLFNFSSVEDFEVACNQTNLNYKSWDNLLSSFSSCSNQIKDVLFDSFIKNNDLYDFNNRKIILKFFDEYKSEHVVYSLLKKGGLAKELKDKVFTSEEFSLKATYELADFETIKDLLDKDVKIDVKNIKWEYCDLTFQQDINKYIDFFKVIKHDKDKMIETFNCLNEKVKNFQVLSGFWRLFPSQEVKSLSDEQIFSYIEKIYKPFFNLPNIDNLDYSPISKVILKQSKELLNKITEADFFEHLNSEERSLLKYELMKMEVNSPKVKVQQKIKI